MEKCLDGIRNEVKTSNGMNIRLLHCNDTHSHTIKVKWRHTPDQQNLSRFISLSIFIICKFIFSLNLYMPGIYSPEQTWKALSKYIKKFLFPMQEHFLLLRFTAYTLLFLLLL